MAREYRLLSLDAPIGKGQENRPDDIAASDESLRKIGAYAPPPEYADEPQRYATEAFVAALEAFQEQTGIKIDGIARPGGPTEQAINNRLTNKPRGAGLLLDPPPALGDTVGNGFKNDPRDVASVQRQLGALGYMPEDPFDKPNGIITERTTEAIKRFQTDQGLAPDGWAAPSGETERQLATSIADLARDKGAGWIAYAENAVRGETKHPDEGEAPPSSDDDGPAEDGVIPAKAWSPFGSPPGVARNGRISGGPLIGINPNFRLPPPGYYRYRPADPPAPEAKPPLPRRSYWTNPGVRRESLGDLPPPRPRWAPPTVNDVKRALNLPRTPAIDDEVRRELAIPRRQDNREPKVYVPEPGSPLAIPLVDYNPHGRPGDPRTVQSTHELTETIKKACEKVFKDAEVTHKYEHYLRPFKAEDGPRRGASYADGWVTIQLTKKFALHVAIDTYTPKKDETPNAGEKRRYANLQRNLTEHDSVTVRMPKPWLLDKAIDKEKLAEFTKRLCEQIKNKLDKGRIAPDKEKLRWERLFQELTKAKPGDNRKKRPPAQE